jgi:acetylornithine deacetylase
VAGAPYGSDLRLFAAVGISMLHVGPGDVRLAHAPDEWVPVDEIDRYVALVADVIRRWCS